MITLPVKKAWKHLQSTNYDHLRIADIWLISSKESILSKLIRWATRHQQGDPVQFSHVAGYTGSGHILEALQFVTERPAKVYFRSNFTLKVIRNVTWTNRQRASILFHAKQYQGYPYGYAKVFLLQLLDCLFKTDKFTRYFSITPYPYCSQLWAKAVAKAGVTNKINNKYPQSVTPDDWDDESLNNPNEWSIVLKHDGSLCHIF